MPPAFQAALARLRDARHAVYVDPISDRQADVYGLLRGFDDQPVLLHVLTRKSLGGIETDLSSRALGAGGSPVPGLYAAGEAAGFGGGGVHGYRALEGTFVGGCLFSGRVAGRAAAAV